MAHQVCLLLLLLRILRIRILICQLDWLIIQIILKLSVLVLTAYVSTVKI